MSPFGSSKWTDGCRQSYNVQKTLGPKDLALVLAVLRKKRMNWQVYSQPTPTGLLSIGKLWKVKEWKRGKEWEDKKGKRMECWRQYRKEQDKHLGPTLSN
jgi:hypothetical protein